MAQKRVFVGGNSGSLTLDGTDTTQYTVALNMGRADNITFHIVWAATTGSLNATATLQESCKKDADESSDTDWVDSGDVSFSGASGTDTKELVNIGNMGSGLCRVKLARSSGSGSAVVYWAIKKKD